MSAPVPAALEAAAVVAQTFADPRQVAPAGGGRPGKSGAHQSLYDGALGVALLHVERACSGHGDPQIAQNWLTRSTTDALSIGPNATLYYGSPAVALVLHCFTGNATNLAAAQVLDDRIAALTRSRLAAADVRIDSGRPLPMQEFDLIHGLTGFGVYHLHRHPEHELTRAIVDYLARITETRPAHRSLNDPPGFPPGAPPWWTSDGTNGQPHPDFPGGHANLGLSHGIGAVIGLLSLAALHDVQAARAKEALERLCLWTDEWVQTTGGTWWPGYLKPEHALGHEPLELPRPSWCYGAAGTARAQQLAGMALNDPDRQRLAQDAIRTALRDPGHQRMLPEIGLCHGQTGLLQAAWRMNTDRPAHSPADDLTEDLIRLSTTIIQKLDADPSIAADARLMEGATGAALALHTIGTGQAPTSAWDRFLVLA